MTRSLPPVFLDTGGWIDLFDRDDVAAWLSRARRAELGLGRLHTSDYVVLETYAFLSRNHRREVGLKFLDFIAEPGFELHPSDADLVDRAMQACRTRPLKHPLSLVDWTTALLMRDHGIRHVLTTDRGFAQLGFEVLP